MERRSRLILLTATLTVLVLSANAQFSMGPQIGSMFSVVGKQLNIGLRGDYSYAPKFSVSGIINYSLPAKDEGSVTVSSSYPQFGELEVPTEITYSYYGIHAEMKRYTFHKEYGDKFAPYFLMGAGINLYTFKEELNADYDKEIFDREPEGLEEPETFSGFSINVGFGGDLKVNDNFLFFELKALLPANQVNGQAIEVQIPVSAGIYAGYRVAF